MKRILLLLVSASFFAANAQEKIDPPTLTEIWQPKAPVVTPGKTAADAPSDAIVLFAGKNLDAWTNENGAAAVWTISDGAVTVKPQTGSIVSRKEFGDMQLHIEWRAPAVVKGTGQGRGNSGIFLMGRYELQVLDNYQNETYSNGQAGSMADL